MSVRGIGQGQRGFGSVQRRDWDCTKVGSGVGDGGIRTRDGMLREAGNDFQF